MHQISRRKQTRASAHFWSSFIRRSNFIWHLLNEIKQTIFTECLCPRTITHQFTICSDVVKFQLLLVRLLDIGQYFLFTIFFHWMKKISEDRENPIISSYSSIDFCICILMWVVIKVGIYRYCSKNIQ